jgi:hypothetical protein
MMRRFRDFYGAHPAHLVILVASFGLVGYAVWHVAQGPLPVRMAIFFVAAVIVHDLVAYPIYAGVDRLLAAVTAPRGSLSRSARRITVVNHVRVPLVISGLLLLVFGSVIVGGGEGTYQRASGLDFAPYLLRWLLITAALFLGSALIYLGRRMRSWR